MSKSVCVIGLGYIGLPTSLVLSASGYKVIGYDINDSIVTSINNGAAHFHEPDLGVYLEAGLKSGLFMASTTMPFADIYIVAVPTPVVCSDIGDTADTSYVYSAISALTSVLTAGNMVIIESTVPVGTTEQLQQYICKNSRLGSDDFLLAHAPERVLPGNIFYELIHNDRVIGGVNQRSTQEACDFYSSFSKGQIFGTDANMAEISKLAENSFRDVNIAFANELSIICDHYNINPYKLISLANKHPRVNILQPGCGVGGHCIAIDPIFLISALPQKTPLLQQARQTNNYKSDWVLDRIYQESKSFSITFGRPPKLGCLGLTFKANVDDLRESPALSIASKLNQSQYELLVCDPYVDELNSLPLVTLKHLIANSDIVIALVAHDDFYPTINTHPNVLDFCGLLC